MSCVLHQHVGPARAHHPPRERTNVPSEPPADIPLDEPWRRDVYDFTRDNLEHSAWGLAHAERDYLLAKELAAKSHLKVDDDVLFAAAFLHDMGGFPPFAKEGVDHADRSAELCHTVLLPAGFPLEKIEAVRDAIETHSYYSQDEPMTPEAKVLHDADTLDFLGAVGVARILSITGQEPFTPDLASSVALIENLAEAAPGSIKSGPYAEAMVERRLQEMQAFLEQLDQQTHDGTHL